MREKQIKCVEGMCFSLAIATGVNVFQGAEEILESDVWGTERQLPKLESLQLTLYQH